MARTLSTITSSIKTEIRTYPSLNGFLFPEEGGSSVSVFNTFIAVMAIIVLTYEHIHDAFKADIQALADKAISGNTAWLQSKILAFQYGDVVSIGEDFVPKYDLIDTSKQIITRAAVLDGDPVVIKVAKGNVGALTPLAAGELTALQDYYFGTSTSEGIGFAGAFAQFVSLLPDRMYIDADIYYQGQYGEAEMKTAVMEAIDGYFATFQDENFNGVVRMERVRDIIQAVDGVTRIVINDVRTRAEAIAFASAVTLDVQGAYQTISGYLISEDDTGNTLNDTITMVVETL